MPIGNRALSIVLRVVLSGIFAYAGVEKWHAAREFVEQIANYQFYPEWAPYVALLLPPFEITACCAVLFLPRAWRQAGAWLMLAMLLMFTTAMARAWSLGINIECGCFGKGSPNIGPMSFARNGVLILAVLALIWVDRETIRSHR
jgi:putative oxidoreductase